MANGDPGDAVAKATLNLCKKDVKGVHYYYTGGVIAKGKDISFPQIITMDIHRNFVQNYSDLITLEVTVPTREFYTHVCQDLENLQVYVKKRQMVENSVLFVRGGINNVKKYKAILMNPPINGMTGASLTNKVQDPDQSITTCTFQLIEQGALDIKMSKFSGLMSKTKPSEALMMILNAMSEGITLDKGLRIQGVHMATPDNDTETDILIPNGTPITDMAQFVQQQYGIYNFGIGSYLFQQHWFVYPLFNVQRFAKEKYKLAISVIDPKHDVDNSARTYFIDNGVVTIATTNVEGLTQQNSADQLNKGTGIAIQKPAESYSSNIERTDNKVVINGTNSVDTFNLIDRPDGYKNIIDVYSDSSNMPNLLSSISGNEGQYVTFEWHFANPEILQPGMPVKIVYTTNQMKTIYGVLHEYHAISVRGTKSLHETPFICTVKMNVYVVLQ